MTKIRPLVCIQGLGFVGSAMAVACATAGTREQGVPSFEVVGLDLPNAAGLARIGAINAGKFPFETTDSRLVSETLLAHKSGNIRAQHDPQILKKAAVVVVDVHFDVIDLEGKPSLGLASFERAIETVGMHVSAGCLVIIETTVPPGTCAKVVRPILDRCCEKRGIGKGGVLLAHAYERVMPGNHYLDSITNYWRVYAGENDEAADKCEAFLTQVVNTRDFPLMRLTNTTASETAKVLENSYRAMNIAFMDEWGRFAERVGVDLFEVLDAIRVRPTHSNIRQPGFGVGGYCLTKDPLFAALAARDLFGFEDVGFPMSHQAVRINKEMPLYALDKVRRALGGLNGKSILLAGISYRQDVADTRYSPSQTFYESAIAEGAEVLCYDPLLEHWEDLDLPVRRTISRCPAVDAIVFAVPHTDFHSLDLSNWLDGNRPYILDANNCFTRQQRETLSIIGCPYESIGRGVVTYKIGEAL